MLNKLGNQRADCLAASGPGDVAVGEEVADNNWDVFVHSQADGGFVHDGDVRVGQSVVIAELIKFNSIREFGGIFIVHAIDFRCFNHNITLHF